MQNWLASAFMVCRMFRLETEVDKTGAICSAAGCATTNTAASPVLRALRGTPAEREAPAAGMGVGRRPARCAGGLVGHTWTTWLHVDLPLGRRPPPRHGPRLPPARGGGTPGPRRSAAARRSRAGDLGLPGPRTSTGSRGYEVVVRDPGLPAGDHGVHADEAAGRLGAAAPGRSPPEASAPHGRAGLTPSDRSAERRAPPTGPRTGAVKPAAAKASSTALVTVSASASSTSTIAEPPKPPPVIRAPSAPAASAGVDHQVQLGAGDREVVAQRGVALGQDRADRAGRRPTPAARRPARTRWFSVTTWRTRRRTSSSSPSRVQRRVQVVVRARRAARSRRAARAPSSQPARRLPYSPSLWACLTRVSTTSSRRPSAARSNGICSLGEVAGVEEQGVALACSRPRPSGP